MPPQKLAPGWTASARTEQAVHPWCAACSYMVSRSWWIRRAATPHRRSIRWLESTATFGPTTKNAPSATAAAGRACVKYSLLPEQYVRSRATGKTTYCSGRKISRTLFLQRRWRTVRSSSSARTSRCFPASGCSGDGASPHAESTRSGSPCRSRQRTTGAPPVPS